MSCGPASLQFFWLLPPLPSTHVSSAKNSVDDNCVRVRIRAGLYGWHNIFLWQKFFWFPLSVGGLVFSRSVNDDCIRTGRLRVF